MHPILDTRVSVWRSLIILIPLFYAFSDTCKKHVLFVFIKYIFFSIAFFLSFSTVIFILFYAYFNWRKLEKYFQEE